MRLRAPFLRANWLVIFPFLVVFFCLFLLPEYGRTKAVEGLTLSATASDTAPSKGEEVDFSVTPSGGSAPYTYCWDFDAPVISGTTKPGTYNNTHKGTCYSTTQNPSYTFNVYGEYSVWVHVTDSASNTEKALVQISVNVGGTTVSATASNPTGPALVGDGTTDNAGSLATWANNTIDGNVTVEFPSGTYRFKSVNQFTNASGLEAIELRPADGATVTLLFDPDNTDPAEQKPFFRNGSPPNTIDIYIHDMTITRDLDGGTMSQKDRAVAFYLAANAPGYDWTVENVSLDNWAKIFDDVKQPRFRRANIGDQGSGLWYMDNVTIATTTNGVLTYNNSSLTTSLYIVTPGSLSIATSGGGESFTDNGNGTLTGSSGGTGTINYTTSAWSITYNSNPGASRTISASWDGVHSRNAVTALPGYLSELYYKSSVEHEHFIYDSSKAGQYSIVRDSYIDHANGVPTNYTFSNGAEGNMAYWHNLLKNPTQNVIFYACCAANVDIEGNFYDGEAEDGNGSALLTTNGNLDVTIAYNHFINLEGYNSINITNGGSNINIHHNIFGLDAQAGVGTLYNFETGCTPLNERTDTCNPTNSCATTTDNTCDESDITVSDPGRYEFVAPTGSVSIAGGASTTTSQTVTLALSASDSGSGMSSTARFPYQEGALMQISNDGLSWSEVRDYSTSTSWTLSSGESVKTVYVRFADEDHNWSETVFDTITYQAATTDSSTSSNSSGGGFSAASLPGNPACHSTAPGSAPRIYDAKAQGANSIFLTFSGAQDPVSYYAIEFGTESGKYPFGSTNIGGREVRSFIVRSLKPNTTYYFRVRAGNGCAPGPWSNEVKVRTFGENAVGLFSVTDSDFTNETSTSVLNEDDEPSLGQIVSQNDRERESPLTPTIPSHLGGLTPAIMALILIGVMAGLAGVLIFLTKPARQKNS